MKVDNRTREAKFENSYGKVKKLLGYFLSYVNPEDTILELGAGMGANLKFLQKYGYRNLYAIEPFEEDIGNPDGIKVIIGTLADIKEVKPKDVIFSASTLYLIPDDECHFKEIAQKTKKYLILMEGEVNQNRVHEWLFDRNYKDIFERYGLKQLEEEEWQIGHFIVTGKSYEGIKNIKMIRVFKKI